MTRHSPHADITPAVIQDPAASPAAEAVPLSMASAKTHQDRRRAAPASEMTLPAKVKSLAHLATERPSPVSIILPKSQPASPLVISCPHAGRLYPAEFVADSAADLTMLRGLEDFATDALVAGLSDSGHITITSQIARAFVDVNRAEDALDPDMFTRPPRKPMAPPSRLVRAGYGLIPRLTACRRPIHKRPLSTDELRERLQIAYTPYHQAIADALARAQALHGASLLVDVHSMPPHDGGNRPLADIILGDLHHSSLDQAIAQRLAAFITEAGFSLAWNSPYAGGFITKHYGRANSNRQSVQIEINRRLYMLNGSGPNGSGHDGPRLDMAGVARVNALLQGVTNMLAAAVREG